MSLMRLFMQTTYEMATAGKWSLMADYFVLIGKIIAVKEVLLIPGVPVDKGK